MAEAKGVWEKELGVCGSLDAECLRLSMRLCARCKGRMPEFGCSWLLPRRIFISLFKPFGATSQTIQIVPGVTNVFMIICFIKIRFDRHFGLISIADTCVSSQAFPAGEGGGLLHLLLLLPVSI